MNLDKLVEVLHSLDEGLNKFVSKLHAHFSNP